MSDSPADPPRPFPNSLCHQCAACRAIRGRASTFIMCTALPEKYPRQPVLACPAFRPGAEPLASARDLPGGDQPDD